MYATRGIITTAEEAEGPGLDMQNLGSYQHSSIQESYQPLSTVPSPENSFTSNASDTTQGDSHLFTMHPVRGVVPGLLDWGPSTSVPLPTYPQGYDGTVARPYGPPLESIALNGPEFAPWWEDSRVMVPQHPYKCGTAQKNWDRKPSICFLARRSPGVRLIDALRGNFEEMDDKDHFPFDAYCTAITIRVHFRGYTSSTDVEKILKEQGEIDGRATARSMQLSTKNRGRKVPTDQMTKGELVKEVSKRIWWYISDLEKNGDLFPFDDRVDEQWCLGQGRMKIERMVITELVHVSSGSWSPIIYVE
ncbi:hypothetical protein BDM02DRAFT_1982801 [Thelephora ganbajun]|uniref:Uncharacterized protein n=1 Tax=Thelephora ganbajun TaxID=370292 RepID=A0ACB6ZHZ6_THEGA|nr:hypothetical protein BDM02DRAFT_1982801 [Thelephora ganbajun]